MTEIRRCSECPNPIIRRDDETIHNFTERKTCSEVCWKARRRRQRAKADIRHHDARPKPPTAASKPSVVKRSKPTPVEAYSALGALSRPEIIRRKLKELDEMWVASGSYAETVIIKRRWVLKAELTGLTRQAAA